MNAEREVDRRTLAVLQNMNEDDLFLAYHSGYRDETNLDRHDPIVKAILESRLLANIAERTKELGTVTELGRQEVKRLADSSDKIEALTRTLKKLTWTLIFLTVVAAAAPILYDLWKSSH